VNPSRNLLLGTKRQPHGRKPQLRLVVALPFVMGLLTFGIGLYAFQAGRTDATSLLSAREAARVWSTPPGSWWWLAGMTGLGAGIGLAIAVAITHQLHQLARRTEFLARRNFSFPVELETDGEVAPLVSAINELLESVRYYARHSVADGLVSFARDGRVLAINPRAAVALGVDAETVLGQSFRTLIPDLPGNARLATALERAFARSEPFDLQALTWVNPRGQRLRVDLHGTVLAGQEPIISVLVVFDAAPDMERVQRQVSRAHRLAVIGSFAAELAHEVRNPLASVFGLVDLLHERLPDEDEGHRHLEVLERAAGRIDRLVSQLLDLVPTEIHDLQVADVTPVVAEAVALVSVGAGRPEIVIREHYVDGLSACRFDPDRIGRVVENLLHNAVAHTPDGGQIDITTHDGEDGAVSIEVRNTGSYIPPEERERIFQPFVSARANGTGLGLAIAQQIVLSHGGALEVVSEPDDYTAFVIRLPVSDAEELEGDWSPYGEKKHRLAGAA
jgi:PAS domain S-box-containing protein